MNSRLAAVLVVLLIALGGGALVLYHQQGARSPAPTDLGQRLVKDLPAAQIAQIRLVDPKASLTLQRKEDGWVVAERDNFPADVSKVRGFVLKTIELKVGQSEPIAEKDRARLQLEDPTKKAEGGGTLVEFGAAGGKALARLLVGKKYFSREVDNPDKARADGRFVLRPEEPGTVFVVSDPLTQASTHSADWIDRTAFKLEKIKSLEVRPPEGAGYEIERSGDNAEWKLIGAKPGEKLEITRANAASYVLGQLELADVAPADVKDTETGLDRPTLVHAVTLAGVSYEIKVGKPVGENYYVSFSSSSADAREKALSQHVLLIPKAKLEDTLKPRAEMLAKKEDTKK